MKLSRNEKKDKIVAEIKNLVNELKKMGYEYSDCASTIVLFDDKMFKKPFAHLTHEQQEKMIVDTLY